MNGASLSVCHEEPNREQPRRNDCRSRQGNFSFPSGAKTWREETADQQPHSTAQADHRYDHKSFILLHHPDSTPNCHGKAFSSGNLRWSRTFS